MCNIVKRFVFFSFLVLFSLKSMYAERVMVIADPHVAASSLLQPGEALNDMLASGRKMLDLSEPAFLALIDTALLYHPDLVLLPGDLTKDGERVSHDLVAAQLARLNAAGIPVLVIPGNHDINNPQSYAYAGSQKTRVPTITDAQFDSIYAAFMPAAETQHDAGSHSYVAQPMRGVTLLAIDGTHGNASVGSLSDATLSWLLSQADQAREKGHLVIAMCHWQLIDHFDQQSSLLAACQLDSAAYIAEQLANHGVHLVLTGHMHISGATTAFYASGDSLVEVTTGSPVAYPCPYRWLTISPDRATVSVVTDDIQSLPTQPGMQTYSRQWQREHIENLAPEMARKLWNTVDRYIAQMKKSTSTYAMALMLEAAMPQTDSARVELFERHMKSSVVDLYILHSDANEPERPEKDSIVDTFYANMTNMIAEVMSSNPMLEIVTGMMVEAAIGMADVPIGSMTEDETSDAELNYTNRTDDLTPVLQLNAPINFEAVEQVEASDPTRTLYDVLGRQIMQAVPGMPVIENGKVKIEK
jgi:3',5'-cyclic AMP phosphodiesterase CpdA